MEFTAWSVLSNPHSYNRDNYSNLVFYKMLIYKIACEAVSQNVFQGRKETI